MPTLTLNGVSIRQHGVTLAPKYAIGFTDLSVARRMPPP